MSSNIFASITGAESRCVIFAGVFLLSIFCSCNKTPTNPVSAPAITTQPASQTKYAGQPETLAVVVTGNPSPTYQWQKNGTPINGATNAIYIIAALALTDAGTYDVVVTNSQGSVTSTGATLTVNSALTLPTISTQPVSQAKLVGQADTFSVVASGNPVPTYQWRKNGAAIAGSTNASYIITSVALTDAGTYDVVVTNNQGSVTSAGATLTVNPGLTLPAISKQPVSQTATAGQSVTFTIVATGNPAPTYQWRKDGVNITGATSASYTITSVAFADAGAYDVVVTNSQGSVTSNAAMLMVTTGCPDPPDPSDTVYRIISPNGGETFQVGQQCTVLVASKLSGSAMFTIAIGRYELMPPSGPLAKYLQGNSAVDTLIFTIPDSLQQGQTMVSSVTDSCLIEISNYNSPGILDYSDCYFRIKNP